MTLSVGYDVDEDEMSVGIAIRNDAQSAELLLRVEEHLSKALRFIANGGEPYAKETEVSGFVSHEKCSGDQKKGK